MPSPGNALTMLPGAPSHPCKTAKISGYALAPTSICRSAQFEAMDESWVTSTTAVPASVVISARSSMVSAWVIGSSREVGSSASRMDGATARARAMAMR